MPTKRHNTESGTARDMVLSLARDRGILRARDLDTRGYSREILRRLVAEGQLVQRSRGLYVPANSELGEQEMLAAAAIRVPHGVICLLSALRFHELTTQNPSELWLAIDHKARAPTVDLPLRVVRFSGDALKKGIEEHVTGGVPVRIYSVAKTIADCFKYRRKIGTDVAIEALRDSWMYRRASMDDLWRYAKVCRVTNVMRPYLEAIAGETRT